MLFLCGQSWGRIDQGISTCRKTAAKFRDKSQ